MRWGTVWLTVALLITIAAAQVITLEGEDSLLPQEFTTTDVPPTTDNTQDLSEETHENTNELTEEETGDGDDNTSENASRSVPSSDEELDGELIVVTTSGPIQGFPWQGKENIIGYIDVPYGVINSPFQQATAATASTTLHDIRDHDKRCPQLQGDTAVGDIDCLTLSIFKPPNAEDASVLFHIHSENFDTGSGDPSIYGPDYLVSRGIILVLPNYRLGPLGFLCTQNDTAPGNMALKDLSLALKWINNNIKEFGGDPNNVAVSGDGRSGALAGLLALSSMSKAYVNKVIAESGSFLSYWALDRDPTATAAKLLEKIAEDALRSSRTDITLNDFTVGQIVSASKGIEFKPCLETEDEIAFITETPYSTTKDDGIKEIAFLIGSATYAGAHEALLQTVESINGFNQDSTLLLPNDLIIETDDSRNEAGERVRTEYFGEEAISLDDVTRLSLYFTDIGYLGPCIRSARRLVEAGATVFFYEFAYVGALNRVLQSVDHPVEGAVRGDIVGYLFTQDGIMPGEQLTEESKMIETLTQMWTNFLTRGSPSTDAVEWKKLEAEDQDEEEWLLIDSEPTMHKGLHTDRMSLWTEIYDKHFIDGNHGPELAPSLYVLILQWIFWFGVYRNASHFY